MVQPLHKLIVDYNPRNKIKWTKALEEVFYKVQASVNDAPPLYFLDYNAPAFLHTDASDFGIGANLNQVRTNSISNSISNSNS
jgi:hypothetical protein